MSNLLLNKTFGDQVKKEVVETNPSFWRSLAIDAIALVSAMLLGYFFQLFVSGQKIIFLNVVPGTWVLLGTLSIFFLASLFQVVLIKDAGRRIPIQIIQVLALGFFLYNESAQWLAAESIAIILILLGSWRARSELNNTLTIRFFRLANIYYGRLVLALALLAAIFYFPYWQVNKSIVPEPALDGVITWSLGLANTFSPDLDLTPKSTFSEVTNALAIAQVAKTPGVDQLTQAEKQRVIEQTSRTIADQLRGQLGQTTPANDESLRSFISRLINSKVSELQERFKQWFFVGWVIIALFIFFSVGRLFSLIMSAVAFIIYQVLLASRFAKLYSGTVTKETLDF